MTLQTVLDTLVGKEGKYSNDPTDAGGETAWGVTIAVARAFGYTGPMKDMPQSIARTIYQKRYWEQTNFNAVNEYSPVIAEELLDTGVNMGPAVAGKFLQRCLNVLNQQGTIYPDVVADGQVGAMTIAALKGLLKARGKDGELVLYRMLNALQAARYIEIAENNPSQEAFEYGWQFNRVGM